MYSAMPSIAVTENSLQQQTSSDAGLAIEDLSIDEANGNGDEEYDDPQAPLGQNVEHACRWVTGIWIGYTC